MFLLKTKKIIFQYTKNCFSKMDEIDKKDLDTLNFQLPSFDPKLGQLKRRKKSKKTKKEEK